ncbi:ANTAR domain-containing protein [Rhodococcus opacus]|uniref:ANTAR domain-containing protein n=1 Tax=Rhodococcus opacus TaxID=37919 RepID=UPI002236B5EE|nr:ANTAR domain-containing protein [Rhodococcus opacus]UZG59840.1 ANTAR domain-containing protein [Rhodococcus opacus]
MTEDLTDEQHAPWPAPAPLRERRRPDGRALLATAKAILMFDRGYSDDQAFDELLDVALRHHLNVHGAARNLVDLAAGASPSRQPNPNPGYFAEWEGLLNRLPPRRNAS